MILYFLVFSLDEGTLTDEDIPRYKMSTPIQDDDDHVVFADADTISNAAIR